MELDVLSIRDRWNDASVVHFKYEYNEKKQGEQKETAISMCRTKSRLDK